MMLRFHGKYLDWCVPVPPVVQHSPTNLRVCRTVQGLAIDPRRADMMPPRVYS